MNADDWKRETDMHSKKKRINKKPELLDLYVLKQDEQLVTILLLWSWTIRYIQWGGARAGVRGCLQIRQTSSTRKGNGYACSHQDLVAENGRAKELGVLWQPGVTPHKPHSLKKEEEKKGVGDNECNNQNKTQITLFTGKSRFNQVLVQPHRGGRD